MLYVSVFVPAEARNKREIEREKERGEVEGERGTKKEAQNPHGVRNKTHVMKELSPNNVPQTGSFTVYHLPLFFFFFLPLVHDRLCLFGFSWLPHSHRSYRFSVGKRVTRSRTTTAAAHVISEHLQSVMAQNWFPFTEKVGRVIRLHVSSLS